MMRSSCPCRCDPENILLCRRGLHWGWHLVLNGNIYNKNIHIYLIFSILTIQNKTSAELQEFLEAIPDFRRTDKGNIVHLLIE